MCFDVKKKPGGALLGKSSGEAAEPTLTHQKPIVHKHLAWLGLLVVKNLSFANHVVELDIGSFFQVCWEDNILYVLRGFAGHDEPGDAGTAELRLYQAVEASTDLSLQHWTYWQAKSSLMKTCGGNKVVNKVRATVGPF
jgi:hypothetical protein